MPGKYNENLDLDQKVEYIQANESALDDFIEEYKPFIASCVYNSTKRYQEYGRDDELSIGMIAFLEAIKSYNAQKGAFLPFAKGVIQRRLIDYYRKEKKHINLAYLDDDYDDSDTASTTYSLDRVALEQYYEQNISEYRSLEILEFQSELKKYNINFQELVTISPKHQETHERCWEVIRFIMKNQELIDEIRKNARLPIIIIQNNLGIPRKTIENGRKYIVAMILLLSGDYPYLKSSIQ